MIEMIAVSAKCCFFGGGGVGSVSSTVGAKCLRVALFFFKSECYVLSFAKITSKLNVDTK